jgi:hypothetical protein
LSPVQFCLSRKEEVLTIVCSGKKERNIILQDSELENLEKSRSEREEALWKKGKCLSDFLPQERTYKSEI